jgi:tetratricopeptide (TPR) repeat protein
VGGPWLLAALAVGYAPAQEVGLRSATGGVAGHRLVILPAKGSGLYSWALPVTLAGLLQQAEVDTMPTEKLAALLKKKGLGDLAGGLPDGWSKAAAGAAAEAGQVGKEKGFVLIASWNTKEPQEKWSDATQFWLEARLQQGDEMKLETRLPREGDSPYRLGDYSRAIRDLAEMVLATVNPAGIERARASEVWRQRVSSEQVRLLAEAEQDIAAGRLEEARQKLGRAEASATGQDGSLLAVRRLFEVNQALCERDPARGGEVGQQAVQQGQSMKAQGKKTEAWGALLVAEGWRLQEKWREAAPEYFQWVKYLVKQRLMQREEVFPEDVREDLKLEEPEVWDKLKSPALEAEWWVTVGLSLYRGVSGALAESVCGHAGERARAEPHEEARAEALVVLGDEAGLRSDLLGALSWYWRALFIYEGLHLDSLECARIYNSSGVLWSRLGDLEHALESYREAMAIYERLEPRSLNCAASYNNIGNVYLNKGDLGRALEWYRKALAIDERLAPGSLDCALPYTNVGTVYRIKGDLNAALEWHRKALAIQERLAPGSPACAMTYVTIGIVYRAKRDPDGALDWYKKALAIYERLAPGSLDCANGYGCIGDVCCDKGDMDRALEWYAKALAIYERLAPGSPDYALTCTNTGKAYHDKGDLDRALELLREAMVIYERREPGSQGFAETSSSLGFILLLTGRHEEALPYLVRAAEVKPAPTWVRLNLVWGYVVLDRLPDAAPLVDQICGERPDDRRDLISTSDELLARRTLGGGNPGCYYVLGRVWEATHTLDKAIAAYGTFIKGAKPDHPWRPDAEARLKKLRAGG